MDLTIFGNWPGAGGQRTVAWVAVIAAGAVITLVLLHLYWPLGVVVAVSAVPIIWLSKRFETRYVVVSRRVQDQQGDVATSVEEAAVGYRAVKSFGRSAYSNANFAELTEKLYETSMEKVRVSSRFWTFLEIIPNLSLVFVLLLMYAARASK